MFGMRMVWDASLRARTRIFEVQVVGADVLRGHNSDHNVFSNELKMKDTTEILHLMEEGTKCQDHDMNRAKEAFRRAQVSFICSMCTADSMILTFQDMESKCLHWLEDRVYVISIVNNPEKLSKNGHGQINLCAINYRQ